MHSHSPSRPGKQGLTSTTLKEGTFNAAEKVFISWLLGIFFHWPLSLGPGGIMISMNLFNHCYLYISLILVILHSDRGTPFVWPTDIPVVYTVFLTELTQTDAG